MAPTEPSTPSGSLTLRPSIWNPPQMPSTGRPAAAWSAIALSSPRDRSHARSEIVARVPGSTMRSASLTSCASERRRRRLPAPSPRASTSVKLLMRGSRTTATLSAPAISRAPALEIEGILRVEPHVGAPRQHAEHPSTGQRLQLIEAGLEERLVAAELVDHESGDEPPVLGLEQCHGAVHRCEHPAAVDVADDDRRDVGVPRQAHVDVVAARRLISAGLPAPSLTTRSKRDARSSYASWAAAARCVRPPMNSADEISPAGWPMTTTWLLRSPPGLRSMGFIAASGTARAASAWTHWARPISAHLAAAAQTIELLDMFCAL